MPGSRRDARPVEMQLVEAGLVEAGLVEAGLVEAGLVEAGLVEMRLKRSATGRQSTGYRGSGSNGSQFGTKFGSARRMIRVIERETYPVVHRRSLLGDRSFTVAPFTGVPFPGVRRQR